ncbi:Ribosomal RNA small subunit methyltransferase B [Clostridiaceae bacterium JG1575]|nr:Ribosomal RNA small subunit methyltransferase B [Clostridiaceae bacterium JG1575]
MDPVRRLAGDLLICVLKKGAFSGAELDKALSKTDFSERDKAFLTTLVYGTLTHLYAIDFELAHHSKTKLSKLEDHVLTQLRLAVFQIRYLDKVPPFAAVSEAVSLVRKKNPKAAGYVNGVLRGLLRRQTAWSFASEEDALSFQYSLKPELTGHFLTSYPQHVREILEGLLQSGDLCLRISGTPQEVLAYQQTLEDQGFAVAPGRLHPMFLHVAHSGAVRSLPGYAEGRIAVQNEAAALPALLMAELVPRGKVLDVCAAPGGKSACLCLLGTPDLEITALDRTKAKVEKMRENFQRQHLPIKTFVQDGTVFRSKEAGAYDGVLLDVPCSGLGLMGKKPDIRQKMTLEGMRELEEIQRTLIAVNSRYVAKGGYLIYSTCTLNPRENEEAIRWFLAAEPSFQRCEEPLQAWVSSRKTPQLLYQDGMLTVLPGQGLDGFFVAILQRRD